jgi:hypothetical protein
MEKELSCKERVVSHCASRISSLKELWEGASKGDEDKITEFNEYGLSFDYVAPGTFSDQKEGYFRYQLSWGGPSDSFEFYTDSDFNCNKVIYRFLDWFDGAEKILSGKDKQLMLQIWEYFKDRGCVKNEYTKAMEGMQ